MVEDSSRIVRVYLAADAENMCALSDIVIKLAVCRLVRQVGKLRSDLD